MLEHVCRQGRCERRGRMDVRTCASPGRCERRGRVDVRTCATPGRCERRGSRAGAIAARYRNALGSAREVVATFDVAVALGYIAPFDAEVLRQLDRIIGTLVRVARCALRVARAGDVRQRAGGGERRERLAFRHVIHFGRHRSAVHVEDGKRNGRTPMSSTPTR
jgi:hypothetical protein